MTEPSVSHPKSDDVTPVTATVEGEPLAPVGAPETTFEAGEKVVHAEYLSRA